MIFKTLLTGATALALAASLSACGTLTPLTGNPAADAKAAVANIGTSSTDQLSAVSSHLGTLIDTLNAHCNGNVGLAWNPPVPPIPTLNVNCPIGMGTGAVSIQTLKALTASQPTPAAPPAAPTSPATAAVGAAGPGFD